jgi:hypothetical protein
MCIYLRVLKNPGFFEKTHWAWVFSHIPEKTLKKPGFFRKRLGFFVKGWVFWKRLGFFVKGWVLSNAF